MRVSVDTVQPALPVTDARPIRSVSGSSVWDCAIGLRDRWERVVGEALLEAGVEALVLVSQAGNYPPWIKLEAWLPMPGGAGRLRGELEIIVDAAPYSEHQLLITARAACGSERIQTRLWPDSDFSDTAVREWTRYALGRGDKPSNYHPVADALHGMIAGLVPFIRRPHENRIDERFRNAFGLTHAKCLGLLSVLVAFFGLSMARSEATAAAVCFILAIAGFVGAALIVHARTVRIAVPYQPSVAPRDLVLVDSWHTVISQLGGEAAAIRQQISEAIARADPDGIASRFETYSYRTPSGYEQRERLVVIKNQSIVHLHVYPFADDVFIGWHAYLNWAQWGESAAVSRRVAEGIATEFRDLRPVGYAPNQLDLFDLNSLSELVHRHIEQQVKRLLAERAIDQEIDFEIIRGDRARSLDRAQQDAQPGGSGIWRRIVRRAAAWQPGSETEIRRSGGVPAASGSMAAGTAARAFAAAWFGWMAAGFEYSLVFQILLPVSREFQVPVAAIFSAAAWLAWLRVLGGVGCGWLADRVGRKGLLGLAILWMGVCNFGAGLAQTLTAFLVCRALLGLGMGAEWTAGTVLAMEAWPARSRGLMGGLLQAAYPIGFLLAVGASTLFLPSFGWRGLLLIGSVPCLIGLLVWAAVDESAIWQAFRHEQSARSVSRGHAGGNTLTACCWIAGVIIASNSVDMFATHVQADLHASTASIRSAVMMATAGGAIGMAFWGWMSDRTGRRVALILPAVAAMLIAPAYLLSRDLQWVSIGHVAQSFFGGALSGLIPSYLAERFQTATRGVAVGFCYQQGLIWGGFAPLLLIYFHTDRGIDLGVAMIAGTVIGCGSVCLAALASPETRSAIPGSDPIAR
jgi:SHS family lactate transporter-like MFS transporter